jgi:hypothetical protein
MILGILAAAVFVSAAPTASAEVVSLGCAASPGSVTYYLTVDFSNATVAIRDLGIYRANIKEREITWSGQAQTFYRLYRETGMWEIHTASGMSVLQCERRKPEKVL